MTDQQEPATVMGDQAARLLAQQLIDAGKRGEPMPAIPDAVNKPAAQYCYRLGQHYAALEAVKQ